ncbi:hypothetical protein ID866_7876 [Astraeus odoratus]|nr:hypothetical protein ID866_7876 [Astraeus odoratus]
MATSEASALARMTNTWPQAPKTIKFAYGILLESVYTPSYMVTSERFAHWNSFPMAGSSCLDRVIAPYGSGT